jgi:phosphatidylglycerol---prolipoprotein diacylglyceryl transferase
VYPTLIQFSGQLGVHTYGLMILTGLFLAFMYSSFRAKAVGVDSDELPLFYMIVGFAGIATSRLFYFLFSEPDLFFSNPLAFFQPSEGGLVFYGGPIGGVISGVTYCYLKKIPVWKMVDVSAPAIMLGLAMGRIGCFFAGCCHGAHVDVEILSTLVDFKGGSIVSVEGFPHLALVFKSGVGVGSLHNVPLYPTQVWEGLGALSLFAALAYMHQKLRYFDGQIMVAMMIFYAGLRSNIEGFRGDSIRGEDIMLGLSTSQSISVFIVLIAVGIGLFQFRKGLSPEKEFVGNRLEDELDSDDELIS